MWPEKRNAFQRYHGWAWLYCSGGPLEGTVTNISLGVPLFWGIVGIQCPSRKRRVTAQYHPAGFASQPWSAPSFLIHLTVPSRRLLHPFHKFKALRYPLPLGRSCPSLDHADIHMLFRAIWPTRSALSLHFHSLRRHFFIAIPSFFRILVFLQHIEHRDVNFSLARTGAITCAEKGKVGRERWNIQVDIFSRHS